MAVERLNAFAGIPYRWGGNSRYGADCWGLVWLVYRIVKRVELRAAPELDARDLKAIARTFEAERALYLGDAVFTPVDEPGFLDLIEMTPEHRLLPFHVGIYGAGHVLHAKIGQGSILTPFDELQPRIRRIYRHAACQG